MNSWTSTVAWWVADYYFLATILMALVWLVSLFVYQPVRRLTIVWLLMAGLGMLALTCGLPTWPRMQILSLPIPSLDHVVARVSREEAHDDYSISRTADAIDRLVPSQIRSTGSQAMGRDNPAMSQGKLGVDVKWSAIIGGLFIGGAGIVSLWLSWGAYRTSSLCRKATPAPQRINTMLSGIVGDGYRVPRVLLSSAVENAIALGVFRPTILLSSKINAADDQGGLEAVLAHEWAHIRNGDLRLLAVSRLMLLLLFANPVYWLLRRNVRLDQELVADAKAARETGRENYAAGLVTWARSRLEVTACRIPDALAICERRSGWRKGLPFCSMKLSRLRPASLGVGESPGSWPSYPWFVCCLPSRFDQVSPTHRKTQGAQLQLLRTRTWWFA